MTEKFLWLTSKNWRRSLRKNYWHEHNNDYTTGGLLDFVYFKENYKLIATDLSKQTNLKDPQQINFIGILENQDHGAAIFFIIEKSEESTFNF